MRERNEAGVKAGLIGIGMATVTCIGGIFAILAITERNEAINRVDRIKQEAVISPPPCPSLQGEDWRVISLGRNTLLVADVIEPGLFFRPLNTKAEERKVAERIGLREVLDRFGGRVLNVAETSDGFKHIVTVTDDTCPEG